MEIKDQIYRGWGNRTKIAAAFKRGIFGIGQSAEHRALAERLQHVHIELERLDLIRPDGVSSLARIMAEDVGQSLLDCNDASDLPFIKHLHRSIDAYLRAEELFKLPSGIDRINTLARSEIWDIEDELKRLEMVLDNFDGIIGRVAVLYRAIALELIKRCPSLLDPQDDTEGALSFTAPLSMSINDLPSLLEFVIGMPFAPELEDDETAKIIRKRLEYNLLIASGMGPSDASNNMRSLRLPSKSPIVGNPEGLIATYLGGTAFAGLFDYTLPIAIPQATRFEHQHIVAGSGHGKTQTLQHLILHDLKNVARGNASLVVLDSQGDLIENISGLAEFAPGGPLADRLVIIDPTDVEYPVALNLFDVGMERINSYSQLEREKMINGILELYDFVLGSLLDAQMTQKQSVIFRYITRLMLHIPNATIITLRELLEDGGTEKYRDSINRLEGSARAFFETEFDSKEFAQTKRQVLRRLWGILENQSFERMFLHPRNKLDLFKEMNSGKVILINTAKDLLKEEGTEIFGRFFIAMIAQAAQERTVIPKHARMPTFVYIDEANDYFDRNIGIILSQARKYKVGMILAHQYLGQLDTKLQEAVFTNTSIKFAGGVSAKDARALAGEMRTDGAFIEEVDKLEFAAFIRGTTRSATKLSIQYGAMESMPRMSHQQRWHQREAMRERYATHYRAAYQATASESKNDPSEPPNDSQGSSPTSPLSDEPQEWN